MTHTASFGTSPSSCTADVAKKSVLYPYRLIIHPPTAAEPLQPNVETAESDIQRARYSLGTCSIMIA